MATFRKLMRKVCMALNFCRYRRRILLICSPCFVLITVYIYVSIALTYAMTHGTSAVRPMLPTRFIASGLRFTEDLSPHPKEHFWRTELDNGALWNFIQHITDRRYNPILRKPLDSAEGLSDRSTGRQSGGSCNPDYQVRDAMPDYDMLTTQMKDFVVSMHCRDYPLILEPLDVCDDGPLAKTRAPLLFLAIKSQSGNFKNREAIRKTWGRSGNVMGRESKGGLVRRIFLLGMSKDLLVEDKLTFESKMHGDIIQWDFADTFFNLTLKDVLFWDWFSRRCPHARFIFKGDDDVFVRTPAILDYLLAEEKNEINFTNLTTKQLSLASMQTKMEQFIVGDVINNAAPLRSNQTKYFVPDSFYKGLYPSYPGGGGVVYSGSLALKLSRVSQRVHLFPIDDVYVGMCLQRIGVSPIHHPAFLTFDFPIDEPKDPCANHTVLLVHKRSPTDVFRLWSETLTPSPECRNATLRVKRRDA
nr:N-acetyllactosaminide beta-1,3-N-acetylglucosaminyltransferase 2 [Misgurnus anguillicaudatus]